jgi:enoyl-CoA hydratase
MRVGLVLEVASDARLEDCARSYGKEMLEISPLGLRLTKECLKMSLDAPGACAMWLAAL